MNTKNTPKNPGSHPMFSFEGQSLRVVCINTKPWFIAADACRILDLGWDKTNNLYAPSRVLKHMDADERGSNQIASTGQTLLTISESGLYKLIMRSDKPAARRFQNWVTRDVLPALRKDGMYVMGEEKVKTGEMSLEEMTLKVLEGLKAKTERLEVECAHKDAIITEHLLNIPIQVWQGLNECYLTNSENKTLAARACKLALEGGFPLTKEPRMIFNPRTGEKIKTWVNVYPKHILDQAAKEMGLKVVAKFDLVVKVA